MTAKTSWQRNFFYFAIGLFSCERDTTLSSPQSLDSHALQQHRPTSTPARAGWRESIMHSLMMAETGIPILMGLLLEANAGMLR